MLLPGPRAPGPGPGVRARGPGPHAAGLRAPEWARQKANESVTELTGEEKERRKKENDLITQCNRVKKIGKEEKAEEK